MKILIDIDGVCCDLVGEVLNRLNKRLNTKFKHDHITIWNFFDPKCDIFTPDEMKHVREIFCQEGLVNEVQLIEGVRETLEKLKEFDHDIVWLTAPWKESKTWCYDRTLWVERELGYISKNTIFAWNKEDISGDILIDDNPAFIQKWLSNNPDGIAFLFRQPWNIKAAQEMGLTLLDGWNDPKLLRVTNPGLRVIK